MRENETKNKYKRIIVVEGIKDKRACDEIIKVNSIMAQDEYYIHECKGYSCVEDYLKKGINREKFITSGIAEKVFVLVDADENPSKRYKDVLNCLNKEYFNKPSKLGIYSKKQNEKINVGIYLCPNNKDQVAFESLLLDSLKNGGNKLFLECINKYFNCIKIFSDKLTRNNIDKRKFRIYIDTLTTKQLGL